jgi:hypothetical protein
VRLPGYAVRLPGYAVRLPGHVVRLPGYAVRLLLPETFQYEANCFLLFDFLP